MSRYADTDSELNEDGEGYFFDDPDFKEALAELERKWFKEATIFHNHLVSEIHDAAVKGKLDVLRHCIEVKGQSLDERDQVQNTPLHWAAGAGQNNVVTYLIERGCDVNAVNLLGDTALHRAVWRSQLSTVRILLENDVDPSIVNRQGHRAIDLVRDPAVGALLQQYYPLEYDEPADGGAETDEEPDAKQNVKGLTLKYRMEGFSDEEENSGSDTD